MNHEIVITVDRIVSVRRVLSVLAARRHSPRRTRVKGFATVAIASCVLTLSAGVAFAGNIHDITGMPGQTGSNVLSSCPNGLPLLYGGPSVAKTNTGTESPFNPLAPVCPSCTTASKKYAGNPGNNATNPKAVSQYDNACSQAALRQGAQLP
jgi:hypothetical protein